MIAVAELRMDSLLFCMIDGPSLYIYIHIYIYIYTLYKSPVPPLTVTFIQ